MYTEEFMIRIMRLQTKIPLLSYSCIDNYVKTKVQLIQFKICHPAAHVASNSQRSKFEAASR